jgi:hypothetical protein
MNKVVLQRVVTLFHLVLKEWRVYEFQNLLLKNTSNITGKVLHKAEQMLFRSSAWQGHITYCGYITSELNIASSYKQ